MQYLNLIGAGDNYIKTINIAAGAYYEKIYVDMPNVQFIGQGSTYDDVVLWFDLIAGMVEPSGASVYSTDGSASVTLSEDAAGFYATNLTIKNYYNTNTLYQKSLTISTDSQAVALLNQADQSYIYNCKITGYHDTLYAQVGRQVYEDCYIEGRTDYIFGYNATVYLTNCEIHTLGAGDSKNGGYVVATKGFKTSGTDDITYGHIFDNCEFTADTSAMAEAGTADNYVNDGTVSIARAWGDSMSIAVINSSISSAYSTEYYGNTSSNKNDRYGIMSASYSLKPSALIEYNNTGAGAVYASAEAAAAAQNTDEGVDTYTADTTTYTVYDSTTYAETFTLLTDATDAAVYSTFAVIFAAENGSMTYSEDWSGTYDATRWTISIYDGDGTTKLGEIVVTDGGTTAASDILATISSALEDGYTLDGVYTDADCSTAYDYAAVTADVTLYITTKAKDTSSVSYNVVMDSYSLASNTTLFGTDTTLSAETIYFNSTTVSSTALSDGIISYTGKTGSDKYVSADLTYDSVEYTTCIQANGATSSSNNRYYAIDLSDYAGESVSITVVAVGTKTDSQVLLSTDKTLASSTGALAVSAIGIATIPLTYTGIVGTDSVYCITFAQTCRVFAIYVTVG